MKSRAELMDEAHAVFNDRLGDLPRLMAKTVRLRHALKAENPDATPVQIAHVWCAEHPLDAARIVAAVAMVAAADEVSG